MTKGSNRALLSFLFKSSNIFGCFPAGKNSMLTFRFLQIYFHRMWLIRVPSMLWILHSSLFHTSCLISIYKKRYKYTEHSFPGIIYYGYINKNKYSGSSLFWVGKGNHFNFRKMQKCFGKKKEINRFWRLWSWGK